MTSDAKERLALYILIGTLPELVNWLTLTFDWTPRGVAIVTCKVLLAACINWRAFIDGAGKPVKPDEPPAKVEVTNTPANPVETHQQ